MKITNTSGMSVQELKKLADEKGVTYNKNATAEQMQELLSKGEEVIESIEKQTNNAVDINALLAEMKEMRALINATADTNKVKDFERDQKALNNFSFSIKLIEVGEKNLPVISWRTITNKVFLEEKDGGVGSEQIIEVTYLKEDDTKGTKKMNLVDFSRFLTRSDKLIATKIKNLNGSDVYVQKQINPETKKEYYVMKPESSEINVTLDVDGKEVTILSTYLNA